MNQCDNEYIRAVITFQYQGIGLALGYICEIKF